jgi:hypothetical protein
MGQIIVGLTQAIRSPSSAASFSTMLSREEIDRVSLDRKRWRSPPEMQRASRSKPASRTAGSGRDQRGSASPWAMRRTTCAWPSDQHACMLVAHGRAGLWRASGPPPAAGLRHQHARQDLAIGIGTRRRSSALWSRGRFPPSCRASPSATAVLLQCRDAAAETACCRGAFRRRCPRRSPWRRCRPFRSTSKRTPPMSAGGGPERTRPFAFRGG